MKIYAHRGASSDFPEMSMAAYMGAIEQGADGFECDLRLTSDGVIVAWHDPDLKRIAGSPLVVSRSSYAQLIASHPIITLDELLDLAIANKKDLALETKHPVPSGGAIERAISQTLKTRAAEIERSSIDVVLMSFSWLATRRALKLGISSVYLSTHWLSLRFVKNRALGPSIQSLRRTPKIAQFARSDRSTTSPESVKPVQRVFVWTVDEIADARLCRSLGVDVVITNRPGAIRTGLES